MKQGLPREPLVIPLLQGCPLDVSLTYCFPSDSRGPLERGPVLLNLTPPSFPEALLTSFAAGAMHLPSKAEGIESFSLVLVFFFNSAPPFPDFSPLFPLPVPLPVFHQSTRDPELPVPFLLAAHPSREELGHSPSALHPFGSTLGIQLAGREGKGVTAPCKPRLLQPPWDLP